MHQHVEHHPDEEHLLADDDSETVWTRRDFLKAAAAAMLLSGTVGRAEDSPSPMTKEKVPDIERKELELLLNERLHWATFEQIEAQGCHCVDGRCLEEKGIAGVPGGDAGVLVAAVSAVEQITGQKVPQDVIARVIKGVPGTFYMHTDKGHGIAHIAHAISENPCLAKYAKDAAEVEGIIRNGLPPDATPKDHADFMKIVTDADNQGCGHLKNMLKDPAVYKTRPEYVSATIAHATEGSWKGEHETIDPLFGEHNEGAVVQVEIDGGPEAIDKNTEIPVLQPGAKAGRQFFTLHPQIGVKRLAEVGEVLRRELGIPFDMAQFQEKAKEVFDHQTGVTAQRLAKGRPLYIVKADPKKRTWTIEEKGPIA